MSNWTHITGVITVEPMGRCQAEARYILDMVLAHLPRKRYGNICRAKTGL